MQLRLIDSPKTHPQTSFKIMSQITSPLDLKAIIYMLVLIHFMITHIINNNTQYSGLL